MSSFGAMARAAEYAAATNAKQRQVSREAEEQKLPPKSTPVSLSAFTKAQHSSRNKGVKAWKPLTLDDIGEESDDLTGEDSLNDSPTPTSLLTSRMEQNITPVVKPKPPENSEQRVPIRVNIPRDVAPVGIDAETDTRNHATYQDIVVPSTRYSHAATAFPVPPRPGSIQTTPDTMQDDALIFPNNPFFLCSPFIPAGVTSISHDHQSRRTGFHLDPDDMSPTKQEEKFSRMRRLQHSFFESSALQHGNGFIDKSQGQFPGSYFDSIELQTDQYLQQNFLGFSGARPHSNPLLSNQGYEVPPPHSGYSDVEVAAQSQRATSQGSPRSNFTVPRLGLQTGRHPLKSTTKFHIPAEVEYPATDTMRSGLPQQHENKTTQTLVGAAVQKPIITAPRLTSQNLEFATQQADLQDAAKYFENSVESVELDAGASNGPTYWRARPCWGKRQSFIPWDVVPPSNAQKDIIEKLGPTKDLDNGQLEAIAKAVNNPAPGLTFPAFDAHTKEQTLGREMTRMTDEDIVIGSDDWCRLKPVSQQDRDRMRRIMSKAAKDLTNSVPEPGFDFAKAERRSQDAQQWFKEDHRADKRLQDYLERITKQSAIDRTNDAMTQNDGQKPSELNNQAIVNMVLGDVIMNIAGYFSGKTAGQPRDDFFKVKGVPEFAIERGGLLIGHQRNSSYFDDSQGGFHLAPPRIARDPRFRPQAHEGVKVKSEEGWKLRHELYERTMR